MMHVKRFGFLFSGAAGLTGEVVSPECAFALALPVRAGMVLFPTLPVIARGSGSIFGIPITHTLIVAEDKALFASVPPSRAFKFCAARHAIDNIGSFEVGVIISDKIFRLPFAATFDITKETLASPLDFMVGSGQRLAANSTIYLHSPTLPLGMVLFGLVGVAASIAAKFVLKSRDSLRITIKRFATKITSKCLHWHNKSLPSLAGILSRNTDATGGFVT